MLINRNYFTDTKKYAYSIAIGNFDGIHKGHRYLLNKLIKLKKTKQDKVAVLSFAPHPVKIIRPDKWEKNLVKFRTKIEQLNYFGVDALFLVTFTNEFSKITAEEFINEYLIKRLNVKNVVVGNDFKFGCKRKGDINLLKKYRNSFNLINIEKKRDSNNLVYSSSLIRSLVKNGKIEMANKVLGYNWEVQGKVIKGNAQGRLLGFPTANIKYTYQISPARGIYAAWVKLENEEKLRMCAISTGIRPHYNGKEEILEVHIFNFSGYLYEKRIRVLFVKKIRSEKKFNSEKELITQMKQDCILIKKILKISFVNNKVKK